MSLVNTTSTASNSTNVVIGAGSGNNRYLVALLSENHWDPAGHATNATINSVNGTPITFSCGNPDGIRVAGWYWLDTNLPASSGTYALTIDGNYGNGRRLSTLYFDTMLQQAPVDVTALILDARGDFTDTLVAANSSCVIVGTMFNVGAGGNSVTVGGGQTTLVNVTENNGIHTHSYTESSLSFVHDYSAFETSVALAFAIEPGAGAGGTANLLTGKLDKLMRGKL